jgi:predicted dienelactone hydrolase
MSAFRLWLAVAALSAAVAAAAQTAGPATAPHSASQPTTAQSRPAASQAARDLTAGYKNAPGPYKTGSTDISLRDQARDKELPLKVRYPLGAKGPLPTVIFSHGAGGDGNTFAELTDHWASHGYVVLLPTHSDSIRLRREAGEKAATLADKSALLKAVKPMDRLADVKFVLDSLEAIEQKVLDAKGPDLRNMLDRKRLAMAGHSAGALTTQMAIGVRIRSGLGGQLAGVGDSRLICGIIISGQGTTNRMFTDDSWKELTTPALVLAGSEDVAAIGNETPQSRREPFEKAREGGKYLVYIQGATHGSYAGKATSAFLGERPTGDLAMITGVTAASTLAFLDAYVLGDKAARAYLAGDKLQAFSGQQAELLRK